MQEGVIQHGQNVVIVDDLIATGVCMCKHPHQLNRSFGTLSIGGSANAAGALVRMQGGNILEYLFIVEVSALRKNWTLEDPVYSIIQAQD